MRRCPLPISRGGTRTAGPLRCGAGLVEPLRRRAQGRRRARWIPGAAVELLLVAAVLAVSGARADAAGADEVRILMLGDSLTAGYGLLSHEALPARLEAALRALEVAARVINGGVSGDTTTGGLARLDWALADDPHAVVVALGANDALRAMDPALSRANLDRILTTLAERGLPVLIAGMVAPRNLGRDYAVRFDPIYPELAAHHGTLFYPFLLDGVATVTALNQDDGIHPNAAGVEVIVGRILPSVLCLIGRTGRPAPATAAAAEPGGAKTDCPNAADGAGDAASR